MRRWLHHIMRWLNRHEETTAASLPPMEDDTNPELLKESQAGMRDLEARVNQLTQQRDFLMRQPHQPRQQL